MLPLKPEKPVSAHLLEPAVAAAWADRHWVVSSPWQIRREQRPSEIRRWEVFRGVLVDPDLTREESLIQSWEIYFDLSEHRARQYPTPMSSDIANLATPSIPSATPRGSVLAIRHLIAADAVGVTRGYLVQGIRPVADGKVIHAEPGLRWHEELIAFRSLKRCGDPELASWLEHALFLAVVGTSRLAVASVETPLPLWSAGLLHYHLGNWQEPDSWWRPQTDPWLERARIARCDFSLRQTPEQQLPEVALNVVVSALRAGCEAALADTLRQLFRGLSLTPATQIIDGFLLLLRTWREQTSQPRIWTVLVTDLVRQLGRHLNAFDLRRFHNQGANYPDALFVDGLTRLLLSWSHDPDLAEPLLLAARWRRSMEGLPVPDVPTSPGEVVRIHPSEAVRQQAEAEVCRKVERLQKQIRDPSTRQRRLFVDDPLEARLPPDWTTRWRQTRLEVWELGRALFLDRPLGIPKVRQRMLVDGTPLVSYLAFSRIRAEQALRDLRAWNWIDRDLESQLLSDLERRPVRGLAVADLPLLQPRPGVVCLEDARLAAADFVITAITAAGRAELLAGGEFDQPGWEALLAWLRSRECRLIVRSPRPRLVQEPRAFLTAYDIHLQPRCEFALPAPEEDISYVQRPGREDLADGLILIHVWDDQGQEQRLPEPAPRLCWGNRSEH